MKKLIFLVLALVAHQVNCQTSPPLTKTNQEIVAKIKQQLKDIEAEQEKLVLSIKGAPKLIKRAKDLQQKWQSVKTPELIKQEQELRELRIKSCVAKKTNPEITKITARLDELYKIIEDLTKDENVKIGVLRDVLLQDPASLTESLQREHQEKLTNVMEQIIKLDKQIAEKTPKQNNEISKLNERLGRLLYRNEIFDLNKRIIIASKIPPTDDENFLKLRLEFNQLIRPIEEKIQLLNRKYNDLFDQLPAEDHCALKYKPENTDMYGGLKKRHIWKR